jgi:hypothetical protein
MMEKLVELLAEETEILERKPAPVLLCSTQTPHALPGREPRTPLWEASD